MTDKRIKMECPFCHCPPERIEIESEGAWSLFLYGETIGHKVICPDCGATFNNWENKQEAINKWNRR